MKRHSIYRGILLSILFCFFLSTPAFSAAPSQGIKRYAFLIGADNGGADRVELVYAASDAQAMADVLLEMGGLSSSDITVLSNPDVQEIKNAFQTMKARVSDSKRENRRIEFIFYYSGHSDEKGLLLKGETLMYKELRDSIQAINADVHVAILDSCSSGAFTRLKGGQRQPPFMMDESVDTRGHAFLTSSSEDEAAQESDVIEASFFTYFLIAALRGAADSTMDGKVTLNEAYSYAAEETLARTEQTLAGAQHASYDIQLAGSGELVLTDLRTASAKLEVDSNVAGRLYIRDTSGRLLAELRKLYGVPLSFGLPSGDYTVGLEGTNERKEARLIIRDGQRALLSDADFTPTRPELTRLRGSEEPEMIHVYNSISFIPDFDASSRYRMVHHMSISLIGLAYRVEGFQAGLLNFVTEDVRGVETAAIFNITGGDVVGGQAAGIMNINGQDLSLFQGAGVFNINGGRVRGFQGAGVFNIAGEDVNGAQGAGIFNITDGTLRGVQAGGIFNIAEGSLNGAQGAGIFNIAGGSMRGFQGAGIFNITDGKSSIGAQVAGIFNLAEDFQGGQVSLVNVAEDLKGAQVGLVNIGDQVRGTQIGLVNISKDIKGIPVGLINISGSGLHHIQGWYDQFGYTYVAFQAGTRNLYTIAYAGVPYNNPESSVAAGVGLGLNYRLGNLYVEGDLSAKRIAFGSHIEESIRNVFYQASSNNLFPAARVMLGFRIFDFLAVFGGFSINACIRGVTDSSIFVFEGDPWKTLSYEDPSWSMGLYPNWTLGVRI
ncbi:MAG: caspase family protein [Spirochaetales bacterium]|nr:caspase family protein [Spirochaetales bacterium]